MDFYRCFVCEVSLNSQDEFEEHLEKLSHLRSLAERKLISSKHLDLLMLLDKFRLPVEIQNGRPTASHINENVERLTIPCSLNATNSVDSFHSNESRNDLVDPSVESNESFLQPRGNNTSKPLLFEFQPQTVSLEQCPEISSSNKENCDLVSVVCLVCSKKLLTFNNLKMHMIDGSHENAKKKSSANSRILRCKTCDVDFVEKKLIEHLIIDHFHIQRAFLSNKQEITRNFECISCNKTMNSIATEHLQSKKHVKKLSETPIEYYMRCRFCSEDFKLVQDFEKHSHSQLHGVREKLLKFYYKTFLGKKRKKTKSG